MLYLYFYMKIYVSFIIIVDVKLTLVDIKKNYKNIK